MFSNHFLQSPFDFDTLYLLECIHSYYYWNSKHSGIFNLFL